MRNATTLFISLFAAVTSISQPFAVYYETSLWTVGFFLVLVAFNLSVDYLTSPRTKDNLQRMRRHGMSPLEINGYFWLNFATFQLPFFFLVLSCKEEMIPRFDPLTLAIGAAVAVSSDFIFYFAHKQLHDRWPQWHAMHHCCEYTSITTNLMFHPFDLALEFSGPILWCYFVSRFVLGNAWLFVVSSAVVASWYSLSHCEFLELQHARHHRHIGTNYFIYTSWWKDAQSNDGVRQLLKGGKGGEQTSKTKP